MEIEPSLRREFALAGNAVFTLEGEKQRFTYFVERNNKVHAQATHWVYVLNGPNNEMDFEFVGGITDTEFYVSPKARITTEAPSAQAFAWFWKHTQSPRVKFLHAGKCGRCGRTLTTPESIRTGIGPTCAARAERKSA